LVCVVVTLTAVAGSVIVTCAVAVQLFASLTVTVYMPALKFTAVEPVWIGRVLHT
jgi:hypothetical protein